MASRRSLTFTLKGKKPSDFTLERVAQYLQALVELVGNPAHVHMKSITPGSLKVAVEVASPQYPILVERVASSKNPTRATPTVAKAVTRLEEMVTEDEVTAEVVAGRTKILHLRGYSRAAGEVVGPVVQRYVARGRLVGLEGKDESKHARLVELGSDREIRGEFKDESLAAKLIQYLWRGAIEVSGTARWLRHPDGLWELKAFRIDAVQELDESRPSDFVRELGGALGPGAGRGAAAAIKKLRG